MKLEIYLTCDNAAFSDGNGPREISRILRKLAVRIDEQVSTIVDPESDQVGEMEEDAGLLMDENGNKVGNWVLR